MSRAVILTAFRGDGEGYGGKGHRDRAYTHCVDVWTSTPWDFFEADSGHEPFNISKSYNLAAEKAGDWDKAILHPPDERVSIAQMEEAVERAGPGKGLVYAFDHELRLTEGGTNYFYSGARDFYPTDIARKLPEPGQEMPAWSGPRVITRDLWEDIGGFDERLSGWGAEDVILAHCAKVLGGPHERVKGPMHSMYHPKHKDASDEESQFFAQYKSNKKVWKVYERITDPVELREYIKIVRTRV